MKFLFPFEASPSFVHLTAVINLTSVLRNNPSISKVIIANFPYPVYYYKDAISIENGIISILYFIPRS